MISTELDIINSSKVIMLPVFCTLTSDNKGKKAQNTLQSIHWRWQVPKVMHLRHRHFGSTQNVPYFEKHLHLDRKQLEKHKQKLFDWQNHPIRRQIQAPGRPPWKPAQRREWTRQPAHGHGWRRRVSVPAGVGHRLRVSQIAHQD